VNAVLKSVVVGSLIVFMVFAQISHPGTATLRIVSILAAMVMAGALIVLARAKEASPIHKAMVGYVILAGACIWVWPAGAGRLATEFSAALLFAVFFLMAMVPLLLGRDVFTLYFARKTTPEAVWETDLFKIINQHLTGFWAGLFFLAFLSSLAPHLLGMSGWAAQAVFQGAIPAALMVGVGISITRWYPPHYQRKAGKGEGPAKGEKAPPSSGGWKAGTCRELLQMMPKAFNPEAAEGLSAVYQFEMSGTEAFVAHLTIADGACTYADGPAERPSVVVKSPADVWLAISTGELDGQQGFMSGRYQVEGDLMLLMRLKSLFSRR
jgi:putative sterol carrier protein